MLRKRWYGGGIATIVSAALVFGGTSFATADTTPETPAPVSAEVTAPIEEAPAEQAVETPVVEEPAEAPADEPATPVVEQSAVSTDEESASDIVDESATAPAGAEATTDGLVEPAAAEPAAITPAAVEPAAVEAGQATLRVKKLGERTSAGGVTPLGGAVFYAVPGVRGAIPGAHTSSLTCTTAASGYCDISVPSRTLGEGSALEGYWIFEGAAPDGWDSITRIGTGQHTDTKTASPYTFFTGTVKPGDVVDVTEDTTSFSNAAVGAVTPTAIEGGIVNARTNPAFPESCGISVALVFDTSQSINSTEMAQMKAAANSFVGEDGLGYTASSAAIYSFATNAAPPLLTSTSLRTEAGQTTVTDTINGLPADGTGFTNWDDAFRKVAFNTAGETYDLVLFLSDGDPTTYGTNGGSNVNTNVSFRNVEEGVLSANAVKGLVGPTGDSTKIVGVGIGLTKFSELNLAAVSGPQEGEDYYLTDFAGLAEKLNEIASKNCGGTLTVVKKTIDAQGTVIDEFTDGWTFTGTTDGDWIEGPDGPTNELALTTGDVKKGSVNFPLDFTGVEAREVTVTEELQAGWTPLPTVDCTDGVVADGTGASFDVALPAGLAVTCTVTNQSGGGGGGGDVGIEKTAVFKAPVTEPVESHNAFDYVLKVTNYGPGVATNVVVTDPIPERLTVTNIAVPDDWTNVNAPAWVGAGNTVQLTTPSLAVGESVEIVVSVVVNPVETPPIPNLSEGDPVPVPELPETVLENTACVDANVDDDPTNDCDTVITETKDIAAIVYTRCVNDAPLLGFSLVKTENLRAEPVNFFWAPVQTDPAPVPASVSDELLGGQLSYNEEYEWPGSAFSPSGISIDYPGWRAVVAADYAQGGGYYLPGTTTVMSPAEEAQYVFNGLILDPSELDYAWRLATDVTLSVNPTLAFEVTYPEATPDCFVARHTEVQIEKTASVQRTDPGKSFTYDLAVENVSTDAAADGVVVTDAIPSDLKITDVAWAGKGTDDVFPTWDSCEVTGQNSAGYGGTLTCELFGPLQPLGSDNGGASEAPPITLKATVNPASKASSITNVSVVDYHTFGDPEDAGRDSDDAVVLLAALPATGGSPMTWVIALGVLALIAGAGTIILVRRRREVTSAL